MYDFLERESASSVVDVGVEPYLFADKLTAGIPSDVELYGIAYGKKGDNWEYNSNGRSMTVKSCNIESDTWPFDDSSISNVILGAIIEHLFDPLAALKEARRVLEPDGFLIISTPNAVRLSVRLKTLLGMNPYDGFPYESKYNRHNHEWTRKELIDILDVAGFAVIDEKHVKINRSGLKSIANIGEKIHYSLADQMVFKCELSTPVDREPIVYRSGLTEETHT
jgi:SAM-dependent methyltransferase